MCPVCKKYSVEKSSKALSTQEGSLWNKDIMAFAAAPQSSKHTSWQIKCLLATCASVFVLTTKAVRASDRGCGVADLGI
jgi:hypothetical protein